MHCSEQPIATAITGEHSTGAIRAMSSRSETEDHDRRGGITEAWNRPTPIVVVAIRSAFVERNLLPPFDQPGAGTTPNDVVAKLLEAPRVVACS